MTGNISVKTGKALSNQSDYNENARYKRVQEKIEYYAYLFGNQFGGNPRYDPKKIVDAKKNLMKYIPQSSDNKYTTTLDKIEAGVKYKLFVVRTRRNGYVRKNGEMVLGDESY